MTDYEHKYFKYKNKYMKLQNMILNNQSGGKIFPKDQILYIVSTITDLKLKKVTKKITDTIIGKNIKPYNAPHITLFHLTINSSNPDSIIFQDPDFYNKIKEMYDSTIANTNDPLILESYDSSKLYSLSGNWPRHFIRNYKQLNPQKIIDFRDKIYEIIEAKLGEPTIKDYVNPKTGGKHKIFSYNNNELFAVSRYYDYWKPHINFFNDFDIKKNNKKLSDKLDKLNKKPEKLNLILDKINHISQDIFSHIDMSKQMKNLTYALKEGREKLLTLYL